MLCLTAWRMCWGVIVSSQHPHSAKFYTEALAGRISTCMAHPSAVAYGEVSRHALAQRYWLQGSANTTACPMPLQIGLDYHYNHSEPDVQRNVFKAQVRGRSTS